MIAALAAGTGCSECSEGDAPVQTAVAAEATPGEVEAPTEPPLPPDEPGVEKTDPCAGLRKLVCSISGEDAPVCQRIIKVATVMSDDECVQALIEVEKLVRSGTKNGGPGADVGGLSQSPEPASPVDPSSSSLPPALAAHLPPPSAFVPPPAEPQGACGELVRRLCADVGVETESCTTMRERGGGLPGEDCAKMLGNYDQVLFEVRRRELANKPVAAAAWAEMTAGDAPSFGPAGAKVTVVEFSDFECPACANVARVFAQVMRVYGDRVRFVFRQFPLEQHPNARLAARASLAAHAQGRFWDIHDALYAAQSQLNRDGIDLLAEGAGLDREAFWAAIDGGGLEARINTDVALGERLGIAGTPSFFVNGQRIADFTTVAGLSAAIDRALAAQ